MVDKLLTDKVGLGGDQGVSACGWLPEHTKLWGLRWSRACLQSVQLHPAVLGCQPDLEHGCTLFWLQILRSSGALQRRKVHYSEPMGELYQHI